MLNVACWVHTWSLWCQFGSVHGADFSPGRERQARLFICHKTESRWRTEHTSATQTRWQPTAQLHLYAMSVSVCFCLSFPQSHSPLGFPWRIVSVLKETVALQSLMERVIVGVEQTHIRLSALLGCLGFPTDTAGNWKKCPHAPIWWRLDAKLTST